MKKLFLIHQLNLCKRDGIVFHVIEVAAAFARKNFDVEVLSPSRGREDVGLPVPIRYLPMPPKMGVLSLLIYEVSLFFYLLFQPELWTRRAIIYIRRGTILILPELVGRIMGVPVVLEENGRIGMGYGRGIRKALGSVLIELKYRLATHIVAVQRRSEKSLLARIPALAPKVKVVPNGVNCDHFRPLSAQECRQSLHLQPLGERKYICFMGRFYSTRGVQFLLNAMPAILEQHPDAELLLVGDGVARRSLEQLVQELQISSNTRFIGFQPYDQLPLYIGASDVCVAPYTSWYGPEEHISPLKLYAYMACGRPVVLSDVPIEMDDRDKNKAALVVPTDSQEALAAGVSQLLDNPDLAAQMGSHGRSAALKRPWDRVAEEVLAMLEPSGLEAGGIPNAGGGGPAKGAGG
ncbi:MAG: glycosyltransferase family 4 protein [Anaerolineales bacterium]